MKTIALIEYIPFTCVDDKSAELGIHPKSNNIHKETTSSATIYNHEQDSTKFLYNKIYIYEFQKIFEKLGLSTKILTYDEWLNNPNIFSFVFFLSKTCNDILKNPFEHIIGIYYSFGSYTPNTSRKMGSEHNNFWIPYQTNLYPFKFGRTLVLPTIPNPKVITEECTTEVTFNNQPCYMNLKSLYNISLNKHVIGLYNVHCPTTIEKYRKHKNTDEVIICFNTRPFSTAKNVIHLPTNVDMYFSFVASCDVFVTDVYDELFISHIHTSYPNKKIVGIEFNNTFDISLSTLQILSWILMCQQSSIHHNVYFDLIKSSNLKFLCLPNENKKPIVNFGEEFSITSAYNIIEIGAAFGLYTDALIIQYPNSSIYAIECHHEKSLVLERNAANMETKDNNQIHIFHNAIGSIEKKVYSHLQWNIPITHSGIECSQITLETFNRQYVNTSIDIIIIHSSINATDILMSGLALINRLKPVIIVKENKENQMLHHISYDVYNKVNGYSYYKYKLGVNFLFNWESTTEVLNHWKKIIGYKYIFDASNQSPQFNYVVNAPPPITSHPQNQLISNIPTWLIHMEPNDWDSVWNDWHKHTTLAVNGKHTIIHNSCEWHLDKTYSKLIDSIGKIEKQKNLGIVMSSEYVLSGHQYRVKLLKLLNQSNVEFDLYGRDNKYNLKEYKCSLPYHNKDLGLEQYRYTVAIENTFKGGYFTEKILDGILSECVVFYLGCTNISSYINPEAFIQLSGDLQNDLDTITLYTKDDTLWNEKKYIIRDEKQRILKRMNLFDRIINIDRILQFKYFVLNLDRRPDRLINFINQFKPSDSLIKFNRVSAIDGKTLDIDALNHKFKGKFKRGELGVMLSYFNLWTHIKQPSIIFEDDTVPTDMFLNHLIYISDQLGEYDLVFLQYIHNKNTNKPIEIENAKIYDNKIINVYDVIKETGTADHPYGIHGGSLACYYITPECAQLLVEAFYHQSYIQMPIDYWLLEMIRLRKIKAGMTTVRLTECSFYEEGNSVDTDIQKDEILILQ
jgi:GR25 family glycosyltransferase involved in LPS biosynthesis